MLTKRERLCGIMANTGFGSLKYKTTYMDTLIEAIIPTKVLKKTGEIPRAILGLIQYPSAENRIKLRTKGISVKYTFANKSCLFEAA